MTTWTWYQLTILVCSMLGAGGIAGIPLGCWLATLSVPVVPERKHAARD